MRACRTWAVAAAFLLGGCGGGAPQATSVAAPPVPRPVADPAAGVPAFLASVDTWLVLLDASGRIARVGPKREASVSLCPGGRRLAVAASWGGRVELFSIGLRRLRAQRIPVRPLHGLACLDPRGRRIAVATGSDTTWRKSVRVLAPGRARVVLRTGGEIPSLDASGVYVSDGAGVRRRSLADGRILARLPVPWIYDVMPSPDGRLWLMNQMPEDTLDRIHLADPATGSVRTLPFLAEQALGWIGPDRFMVIGDGFLRILDTSLAEVRTVRPYPAFSALLDGERIVAVADTTLIAVPAGGSAPEPVGTVPPGTYLIAAL